MRLSYAILLLATSGLARGETRDLLQCKDENNRPVDWYVLYKLPRISQSSNPIIRKGLAYLYITNNTVNTGWRLSVRDISAKNSIPGNTLTPLYNDTEATRNIWVLYNDDPPNKSTNARYGHTKGVVMAAESQGFWLIHSVPKFPPVPRTGTEIRRRQSNDKIESVQNVTEGEYDYPPTGVLYGQSFLCISLGTDQFDVVGRQLMYNQIVVYRKNHPQALSDRYPILASAVNQTRIKAPPYNNKAMIRSLGTLNFTSFAKSDKWQKDLYDDFVAPQLQSDMYAETWLNGRGRLPTDCNGVRVYNIESIVLNAANVDFRSSHDHSKWAVTTDNNKNRSWVCIGDINRADTQYNRGGGTVCMNFYTIWKQYYDAVNDVEPCPRRVKLL